MSDEISRTPDAPVLVIGACGVDIVGRLTEELVPLSSTPARIRTSFGGVARNVAENLSRLGQAVILVTAVGEDENGQRLLANLEQQEINLEAVRRSERHPTGSYLAVINSSGQMQFGLDDMRAISIITADYLRTWETLFKQAALVFIDANLPKESIRTIMSMAHREKLAVCADPTSHALAGKLRPYLPRLKLITPNFNEADILIDRPLRKASRREARLAAKELVSRGVDIVIITGRRKESVMPITSGYVPAIRTEVIDPTGAGDALTATVIYALMNHIPLDDALRLGVLSASLTLRYPGTVVPDLSLEKLYDQLSI
jgi:pseudouridine kinase